MSKEGEKFMRMLVFFDLPTLTKEDRRIANGFRKNLKKDGYIMMQWSVYSRICKGLSDVEKHSKRLKTFMPRNGNVRLLTVTEKQYISMEVLVGNASKNEKIGENAIVLL